MTSQIPDVLIVHEWLEKYGGAENVVDEMLLAFPGASVRCSWDDSEGRVTAPVSESLLARTPLRKHKALSLPFQPFIHRKLKADVDALVISSHLFAHHARAVRTDGSAVPKFVYAHTPARYIWEPEIDRRGKSLAIRFAAPGFKALDKRRSRELASVAANSKFVADRILRTWGIQSEVIYPPVNTALANESEILNEEEVLFLASLPDRFILGASRFVPYKNVDAAITVGETVNTPVVLAGDGPDFPRLTQLAQKSSVPVLISRRPSNALLRVLFERADLYVFPPVEDFGIMPLEAMVQGTPVIANSVGGAAETCISGVSGACLPDFSSRGAIKHAVSELQELDRTKIREHARTFSADRFRTEISSWVSEGLRAFRPE